jgi:hypothetical protein
MVKDGAVSRGRGGTFRPGGPASHGPRASEQGRRGPWKVVQRVTSVEVSTSTFAGIMRGRLVPRPERT